MQSFVICLIYRCQYSLHNRERCYFVERLQGSLDVEHARVYWRLERIWMHRGARGSAAEHVHSPFLHCAAFCGSSLHFLTSLKKQDDGEGDAHTLSLTLPIMARICPLQFVHVPNLSCNVSGLRWMASFFGLCTDKWSKTTGKRVKKKQHLR